MTDVTDAVCAVLIDLGCDLVIVDELHNLNLATRAGAEVSDQLKYFAERLPATFVYAGIDVERVGLFSGTRGRQIASRFATIATKPFGCATTAQRDQWCALVATLEQTLQLRRHRPGTLVDLAAHLHDRTGGMIGSLSHLLRAAAIDAIISGDREDHQDQPGRRSARPRRRRTPRDNQSRPQPPSRRCTLGPSICRVIGSNGHRLQGRLDPTQLNGIPPMRPLPVPIPAGSGRNPPLNRPAAGSGPTTSPSGNCSAHFPATGPTIRRTWTAWLSSPAAPAGFSNKS